jgi:hypothetical protein
MVLLGFGKFGQTSHEAMMYGVIGVCDITRVRLD